jgi:hypothetical protein
VDCPQGSGHRFSERAVTMFSPAGDGSECKKAIACDAR